jgi:hypothetical protein
VFITVREVAIILRLQNNQLELTPAEYPGILVGVRGKMTIVRDHHGLEGVS